MDDGFLFSKRINATIQSYQDGQFTSRVLIGDLVAILLIIPADRGWMRFCRSPYTL